MFTQMQALPPTLERLANTPVLASEMPSGFTRTKLFRFAPNPKLGTLGVVRIDFVNAHTTESASYALTRTNAAAVHLAQREAKVSGGSLFHVRAVAVGRFAVAVAAVTATTATSLLRLAVAHLRRSGA
jgi:hypothetical protein